MNLVKQMKLMHKKDFKFIQEKKEIIDQYLSEQRHIYEDENRGKFTKIYPLTEYYHPSKTEL